MHTYTDIHTTTIHTLVINHTYLPTYLPTCLINPPSQLSPSGMVVLRGPELVEFLSNTKHKDKNKPAAHVRDAEGYQEFKLQTSRFFNDKDNQNVRGIVYVRGKAEDLQPGLMGNLMKVIHHQQFTPYQHTILSTIHYHHQFHHL